MRTPPTNWTTLMAQPHTTETRVDIAGVSYYGYDGESGIWSLATRNALFENFGAGNCHAGQIDLTLVNPKALMHHWKKYTVNRQYRWDKYTAYQTGFYEYSLPVRAVPEVLPGQMLSFETGAEITSVEERETGNKYEYSTYGESRTIDPATVTAEELRALLAGGFIFCESILDLTAYPLKMYDVLEEEYGGYDLWILFYVFSGSSPKPQHDATGYCRLKNGVIGTETSSTNDYPADGYDEDAGAWFTLTEKTESKGDYIGDVTDTDPDAYPQDGADGDFWYTYDGASMEDIPIPTMAKMEVYVRLTNGTLTTDWVRKGVYFIDTREWDAAHEFLTITGYDAMLKAEQPYLTTGDVGQWPKVDTDVVDEICEKLDVELDTRTVLNKGYMVQLPAVSSDGSDSDTVRTVLGYIGAAYGGNWIITEDGTLRLVPLNSGATPIALGMNGIDLQTFPAYDALGIVHLVVSEEAEYTAGTTGRDIEISCPWGTQTMANNLLSTLSGYVYQPLAITTAFEADPLWELGDPFTFNGYTSVMADMMQNFSLAFTADISAPNDEEINHEYPYVSKEQQQIKREIARSTASLKIDVDEIKGEVQGIAPKYVQGTRYPRNSIVYKDGKYWKCIVEESSATWDEDEWDEQSNGVMSSIISQTTGAITLTATAGDNSSTVKIMANGIEVDSAVVRFSNIVADSIVASSEITSPEVYGGTYYSNTGGASLTINGGSVWSDFTVQNEAIDEEMLRVETDSYGHSVITDLYLQSLNLATSDGDGIMLREIYSIDACDSNGIEIWMPNGRYWHIYGGGIEYCESNGEVISYCVLDN